MSPKLKWQRYGRGSFASSPIALSGVQLLDEPVAGCKDPVDAMVRCEQRVREVLLTEFGGLLK